MIYLIVNRERSEINSMVYWAYNILEKNWGILLVV